jgi:prepilin-type N-terminal cleavage/methylation domain-containing protein
LSGFRPVEKFKKLFNPAFTLAEVLITLGIIGVVAAMTIPTLMAKINERQTVTKVKKAYSSLSNAMRILEHDEDFDWASCQQKDFSYGDGVECINQLTYVLKGSYLPYDSVFDYYKTWAVFSGIQGLDGITYLFQCGSVDFTGILVDVNGVNNGPNEGGKDVFGFRYDKTLYDPTTNKWSRSSLVTLRPMNYPVMGSGACDKTHISEGCTAQVLETGRMDYLK